MGGARAEWSLLDRIDGPIIVLFNGRMYRVRDSGDSEVEHYQDAFNAT